MAAERSGIPAVSIVATPFLALGQAVAKGLGINDPKLAEYPGVPLIDTDSELRDKVVNKLLPQILEGWGKRASTAVTKVEEPSFRDIVFRGTVEEVHKFFYDHLWTDGLPIIPPTVDKVERFLQFTDRAFDEVLGVCQPEYREATVWNVAVNGVIAGCRPEYMPLLIALVEAIVDPAFLIEDAGATPGWEPLITLHGPIIKELDFNYEGGVMRTGRQANTSIGRFLKLYMRNVPGCRIPPGTTDKSSIGYTFNVVLPENEDAVAAMGWQPASVDLGFASGENVVSVRSCISITQPVYTGGSKALNHVQIIAEVIGQSFAYWCWLGIRNLSWYPLIVMCPSVAKAIADDGWTKDDIRKYLYDHVKVPAGLVEKYAHNTSQPDFSLKTLVEQGTIPAEYCESDDPNRLLHVFIKPEWTSIIVAGDPGRNQSRGYVQNQRQGIPVSKRIHLPHDWQAMLTRARES